MWCVAVMNAWSFAPRHEVTSSVQGTIRGLALLTCSKGDSGQDENLSSHRVVLVTYDLTLPMIKQRQVNRYWSVAPVKCDLTI
jgi:hypothetical protein